MQIALYEECGGAFLACNVGCQGCGEMQGFLFSEALPAHEVDEFLAAKHMLRTDKAAASAA